MKLLCPECRRENEPERIYCHDCGARLDRSKVAQEKAKEEDPKDTQRRLQSMLNPKGAKLKYRFFQASKLLLAALTAAVLVQMFRAPDVPERNDSMELTTQINLDLENSAMGPPNGPTLQYSEEQVNAYLAYTLKSKQKALSSYLQFERAVVAFEEGLCRATVERSLSGYSIFTTTVFSPRLEKGTLTATSLGGSIGRLPIHPALMQYCGFLFSDLRAVLERDRKSIVKLGGVELHPKMIVLLPKPQT